MRKLGLRSGGSAVEAGLEPGWESRSSPCWRLLYRKERGIRGAPGLQEGLSGSDTWLRGIWRRDKLCGAPCSPPRTPSSPTGPLLSLAHALRPRLLPRVGTGVGGGRGVAGMSQQPACFPFHYRQCSRCWPICCYWHPKAPNYDD